MSLRYERFLHYSLTSVETIRIVLWCNPSYSKLLRDVSVRRVLRDLFVQRTTQKHAKTARTNCCKQKVYRVARLRAPLMFVYCELIQSMSFWDFRKRWNRRKLNGDRTGRVPINRSRCYLAVARPTACNVN